jgi:hypothetical protein
MRLLCTWRVRNDDLQFRYQYIIIRDKIKISVKISNDDNNRGHKKYTPAAV